MLTAEVLALTTRVEMQVTARTPLAPGSDLTWSLTVSSPSPGTAGRQPTLGLAGGVVLTRNVRTGGTWSAFIRSG